MAFVVILAVSFALVAGAAWGIYGSIGERTEGFVVALAGGALIVSAVLELVEPAARAAPLWSVGIVVLAGAAGFGWVARLIARRFGRDSGGGLLAAITLDGIPENLALGVALIGAGPLQVAALSGSIFLSNLPEAAGGAREMSDGRSNRRVLLIWLCVAAVLTVAALAGHLGLAGVPDPALALIQAFAGGAVVASLATTVFPGSFEEDGWATAVATALGLVLAIGLDRLG